MPAPYHHRSGLPGVYDRTPDFPDWARVLFREDRIAQAAEVMEAQSILEGRGRRVAERIMRDGDRIEGAEILIDAPGGAVTITPGRVYARGDVRPVPGATLSGVPMTGEVSVGVRIVTSVITEQQEPALLGLHPGTEAEGEAGAGREVEAVEWGYSGDGEAGDLFPVYLLKDGVPVDQTPPPALSGVTQAIALYDRDAHGSYVVRGCTVRALGLIGGEQHFSIAEGTANILGFKRVREAAIRHTEPEDPDLGLVDAEPHVFADGGTGTAVIQINRGPLAALVSAIITRQRTITLTKGATGTLDLLPDDSVTAIVSVVQGATTYAAGTDYILNADRVDWSPAGSEPASGSSYDVTYRYLDAATPVATTADTVSLSGGVTGTTVLLSYTYKLPRNDLLCLDADGLPVYVRGVSSVAAPRAPAQPAALLALAEIRNDWRGPPEVINTDVRSVPYVELWAYIRRLFDALDLIALERLRRDIDSREPVAKKGVFVDPWESDFYRDEGEAQTGAVFGGQMRLAIDPTIHVLGLTSSAMLDWTPEVVIRQELATGCMRINPYANFEPLPASLVLDPPADFWSVASTQWTSAQTQQVIGSDFGLATRAEVVGTRRELIANLRQIPIDFLIRGFGPGEALSALTFDGLNVLPAAPLVANASGVVAGTFTIPANVPAGTKVVVATGAAGTTATAQWVGQGTVEISVMRRVATLPVQPPRDTDRGRSDPLAQTFTLVEPRHVAGVDLRVCAVGDEANGLLVELRTVENGIPTGEILAQTAVSMTGVSPGQWIAARFPVPVYLTADREFCFVVKTDDAEHALSIGRIGDFDAAAQRWIGAQPYSVGVLLSSSNARTWTPHQSEDLTFRLVAARFAPTTKMIAFGQVHVSEMSDLIVRGGFELPTADASIIFEVERADGRVTRLLPGQLWELAEFVTEAITVRAILSGTPTVSPTLYARPALIAGRLRASGTYVSRAFSMGAAIRLSAFVKSRLPPGSTLAVEIDAADDNWTPVAQHASTVLDDGWIEREYRVAHYSAPSGRIRLTLAGTPAARPVLSDLRAVSV
jgi:hypothetical protein